MPAPGRGVQHVLELTSADHQDDWRALSTSIADPDVVRACGARAASRALLVIGAENPVRDPGRRPSAAAITAWLVFEP